MEQTQTTNNQNADDNVSVCRKKHDNIQDNNKLDVRGSVLGQPVKRENPNRKENKSQNIDINSTDNNSTVQQTKNTEKGSWADALEKAIMAISQDN